jgi:hypothetical protein
MPALHHAGKDASPEVISDRQLAVQNGRVGMKFFR